MPYLGPPVLSLPPSTATDQDGAANSVAEGAAVNTLVGITASAASQFGFAITYALSADSSGGGFKIDPTTGVVTVADPGKINFETAAGHAYTFTVDSSDGFGTSSQSFTINVGDVAPTTPVDSNGAANSVAEGAAANTLVGITASSSDINGPGVTWSLSNSAGGAFKIDAVTGVVSIADPTKIDFESTAPGHTLVITAVASDGTLTSAQNFTISVSDVAMTAPVDSNAAANTVIEGSAAGTSVGVTAFAVDPNGPATTYSLTADTSLGGFTISAATGVVTVADPSKIDFESTAPGHTYSITVQAANGLQTTSQSFTIGVADSAPTVPVDSNAAANTVVEGAANGSVVGVTGFSTDVNGPPVTYALTGDTSLGGFTINAVTGIVTVADSTKIDFETAAGHAYTITVQSSDGQGGTSSQTFAIAVTDIAPSTPVDSNGGANTVAEGAAAGSTVGITASSTDINGPGVTYALVGDTSLGGFTINSTTGVVTVADSTKIDFESTGPGHTYTVTAQASDGTFASASQTFTIAVTNAAPSTPVDGNAAANTVAEGASNGSTVGVTASSTDPNGPAVTWSLTADSSLGGFTINAATGIVTVADSTKIDFETAPGHAYTVTAQASDGQGGTSSQNFSIAVTDVAPSTPVDSNAAANSVAEGAANGSTVGVTASATDINGPAVTYALTGDTSLGGFTINAATGVVTVADSTKIDFESSGGSYTVTAQASDGQGGTSTQTFTIAVTDVAPSTPVDSNAAANSVAEGAAAGSTVGVTASSTDVNGPAVTYSLIGDTSLGGFTINAATGVVTVADSSKIDFESTAPGHSYTVTAQASDGQGGTSSQNFTIAVTDVAPSTPTDSDAATNTIVEGAANGSTVGVTAFSTDVNGPAVTYSLTGDTSLGGFTINAATGIVTVADSTKIDFESPAGHAYTVTAQASDGQGGTSSQNFSIAVTNVAPSTPVDSDGAANQAAVGAPVGAGVGVTASSTDVNGPGASYSLVGDTSGGAFTINSSTGKVTVADPSKIHLADASYDIRVDASDGALHSQQTFTLAVVVDAAPVVTAGHTLNYTENQAATAIDPALTVTDSDNANQVSATVQITANYVNGEDVLGFTNQNGITGSFNAATGTMTLTGSSSVANYQTALASVTYVNTSDNPSGAARTVTITTNDGTLDSAPATDTINVTPVNDAPVVTAGHTLNYTENQAATAIDTLITVTDVDSANLASATVQITGNYANGQDVLGFTNQNGISGAFNAATGTMTLTGSSNVANYQTALDSVTYVNTSENPSGLARTVTIITNDGVANSVAKTDTINVTPVNDAPVTTAGGTLNYTENQAATAIDATVTVADVDSANLASATVQITGGYVNGQDILGFTNQNGITGSFNAATGTMTLTGSSSVANYQSALDSMTYFNNSDNPSGADRTVTYIANDGALNSNSSTSTIHVTAVNDAPVVTATGTLAYTENQAATAIAPALTVTDADTATLTTASVQISANYINGEDLLAFTNTANITGSFDAATGTMTLTGTDTVAHYQAALASVTYADNSENPSTAARTVTFTADDGQAANHLSAGSNHTITVASVDDAPVNNNVPASFTVGSGFAHTVTGLSITDVDAGSFNDITTTFTAGAGTVSIGNGGGGTAGIAGGATVTTNGSGTVVLTGTTAEINTSLSGNNVVYTAADNAGNTLTTLQMATNDHGHTGAGGPITDTDTINVGVIPQVWFINQDQSTLDATATRGSQTNPFDTVDEFNASGGPGINDYIYVKAGTYSGEGINLKAGQTLLGDDQALSFANPLGGPAIQIEDATGARPTINVTAAHATDQGIALASGNTVAGIIVTTNASGQVGVDDSGASVGTLNMSDTDVTGSGQAINLTHGGTGGSVVLGTVSSTGGATGIALGGALATNFSATTGTLSGHSTSEFSVNGGSGTVSYGGAIGDGTGLSASIVNRTGGTVTLTGNVTDGNDTGGGIGISGNANTTINFTGTAKTLDTGIGDGVSITNNTGSTVNFSNGGLTVHTTNGTAFQDTVAGTVSVTGTGNTLSTTGTGTALNLANVTVGAGGVTFDSASTTNAANGIVIDTVTGGAINVNGGTIAGATANGVDINAAHNNISIASTIASTAAGHSVQVTNSGVAGGNTISFSGAITDPGLGVNLDNNDQGGVATVNFSGGMNIDSTTHTGFNATNGGAVNVTNGANNSIATTTGTALNVANTTIGASELNFHDISVNGAVNGIVLNTTGSTGGLNVTGSGASSRDGSGGTIQNTTGDGVLLTSASQVSLTHMNINSTGGQGVSGLAVNGFVSDWNSFSANGNATKEGAMRFGSETDPSSTGLTGGAIGTATETRIDNTLISGSFERGVSIFNNSGTLTQLNVHGTTIQNSTNGSGMLLELRDNAVAAADLQNSTFTGNKAAGFQGTGTDQSNLTVNAIGAGGHANTFSNNNDGVLIGSTGDADVTTEISNNNFSGNHPGVAITVSTFQSSTINGSLSAKILNNTISVPASGLNDAIQALMSGTGTVQHIKIDGNTITDSGTGANGIFVGTPDAGTSPDFTAIITNNTVTMTDTVNSGNGISAQSTKGGTAVFKIEGNTVTGAGIDGIFLFRGSPATVSLERGVSGSNTASVVLAANNPGAVAGPAAGTLATEVAGTVTVVNNGTITLPLIAAAGGIAASTPTPGDQLTQADLDTFKAFAILQWKAAGASQSQLDALGATTFSMDHLSGGTIGEESSLQNGSAHITIDTDAAGHGWFIDKTPWDNVEFTAQNAAKTEFLTDPTSAAAGHLDLLTTVTHELGHVLGLPDLTGPADANDLMYINLVDGERRVLPDTTHVAQAPTTTPAPIIPKPPPETQGPLTFAYGNPGNDTVDAGKGGGILWGGAGADAFVFASVNVKGDVPPPVTHVMDYSFAEGDKFDFSALTSQFHPTGIDDNLIVRAVEDPSGTFAKLQVDIVDPNGMPSAPIWVDVAQIAGAHTGDTLNVLVDSHAAVHLAQIHVGLLI